MLQSKVFLDLPSEALLRDTTMGEWFLSLFGKKPDLRDGSSILTVSALAVVEGLTDACHAIGVDNAIALVVDGRTVFNDLNDEPRDLDAMFQAASASKAIMRDFRELQVALSHRESGLNVMIEIDLRNRVLLGHEELSITLSARLDELAVGEEEDAYKYRSRVRSFVEQDGPFDVHLKSLDQLTLRLVEALGDAFPGAEVRSRDARVRLVRLRPEQLGRMRSLPFGKGRRKPRYRSAPARRRRRSSQMIDPFFRYYFDPYHHFALWALFDALMEADAWHHEHLYFHEPDGTLIGRGDIIDDEHLSARWSEYAAVDVEDDGSLQVGDSLPSPELSDAWDEPSSYDDEWGIEPAPVFHFATRSFVSPAEPDMIDLGGEHAFFTESDDNSLFGDSDWQDSVFGSSFGSLIDSVSAFSDPMDDGARQRGHHFGSSSSSDEDSGGGFGSSGFDSDFGDNDFGSSDFGSVSDSGFGSSDFGSSDFGSSDFGSSDFGSSDFGSSDFGSSDFGSSDFGSSDFGSSDFGSSDFGSDGWDDSSW